MAKTMNKFKVGDVVQMKSGGPKMTVDTVNYPYNYDIQKVNTSGKVESYHCKWFNGKKVEEENFAEESLMFPEEDKKEGKQGE